MSRPYCNELWVIESVKSSEVSREDAASLGQFVIGSDSLRLYLARTLLSFLVFFCNLFFINFG